MSSIFISHSSRDHESAKSLGEWLREQAHASYFLDFDPEQGIAAGKRWEDELYKYLRLCRAAIALVSPNWLASRWCFAEITQARAAGKPIFLVKIAPCETKGLFTDIQHLDLTVDREEGYRRLARGLKEVGIDPGETFEWDPSRAPFPGLLAFEEDDAAIFFGRDPDIQKGLELLDRLRLKGGSKFVLCLGASGSGKSSLMRAGLIPRLRKNRRAWLPIVPFRPQEDPLEELALKLAHTFEELGDRRDWRAIYDQISTPYIGRDLNTAVEESLLSEHGLRGLAQDLRSHSGQEEATVLLAIDQAEELFGYSDGLKSRAFLKCLRHALEASGQRLMVIATMRSDAFANFQTHPDLQDFAYEPLTVAPIPLRDLPQIVEGPAHLSDIRLEPGLVQMLVQDATTSDALPLLAFTLRQLFERYGQDRQLEIREYEYLGKLEGSVRVAANRVIETMSPSPEEIDALRVAFVPGMVRVNEEGEYIRRRARWLDLPARAHALLNELIDARLLVSRAEDGQQIVEVAHEALLRSWPRLENWLREDRDNLRVLDDLQRAADEWHAHGQDEGWLAHHGERLQAVETMLLVPRFGEQLAPVAKNYYDACINKRRLEQELAEREALAERKRLEAEAKTARRTRIAALLITAIATIAVIAAIFGWHQAGVAEKEGQQALAAQSKALSSLSRQQTDQGRATLGTLLALEALPQQNKKERPFVSSAEASLLHAIFSQRERQILRGHADAVNKVAFSPNGEFVVTASRDHTARIWNTATGKATATLHGHEGQIYWAEFSPDGKQIVTASSDKTARLWSSESGKTVAVLRGHEGEVFHAAFSQDGRQIITASGDGTARLWDAGTGQLYAILRGHQGAVWSAAFSPDGTRVVTASEDHTARIWDVTRPSAGDNELTSSFALQGHNGSVVDASFSPDGRRVLTASWDHSAQLWDALTGHHIRTLEGHRDGIDVAVFSPDGKLIATTSADSTVRLWDGATGEAVSVLEGHKGPVHDAEFSLDSRRLISAADDGTAILWDVSTHKAVVTFSGHTGRVWSTRLSPDGRYVATASEDGTARIWDATGQMPFTELRGHEGRVHRAAFSPDGLKVVTVSDDMTARIWDAKTGNVIEVLKKHKGALWYATFSPDSRRLVTTSTDGSAMLWDSTTGDLLHTFSGHEGLVAHAAFSPDGQQVITGGREKNGEGSARVWETGSGDLIAVLHGHKEAVNFVAFSHDGRRIVTASQDGTARLWNAPLLAGGTEQRRNADDGALIAILRGHRGPIINGAFSPDDRQLATVSWDKTTRLWDVTSGEPLAVLRGHDDAVLSVAFSPDGSLLVTASADNTARIWHAADGEPLQVLKGHEGEVYDASFSAEGRLVITASADGTARLWHVASGLPVATLKGHRDDVVSAAFDPGGQQVVTASWDHTARLWKLPIGAGDDWIRYARDNVPRHLTDDERRLYLQE